MLIHQWLRGQFNLTFIALYHKGCIIFNVVLRLRGWWKFARRKNHNGRRRGIVKVIPPNSWHEVQPLGYVGFNDIPELLECNKSTQRDVPKGTTQKSTSVAQIFCNLILCCIQMQRVGMLRGTYPSIQCFQFSKKINLFFLAFQICIKIRQNSLNFAGHWYVRQMSLPGWNCVLWTLHNVLRNCVI